MYWPESIRLKLWLQSANCFLAFKPTLPPPFCSVKWLCVECFHFHTSCSSFVQLAICWSNSTKLLCPNGADRRSGLTIDTSHALTRVCMCVSKWGGVEKICRSFQTTGPRPKSKHVWCMIRSGNTVLVLQMRCLFGGLMVPPDLYFTDTCRHGTHF